MTSLVLHFVIAAFITILVAKYAVPIFLKGVAIPSQIVPIVNIVLFIIIFVLSFSGLRYVLSPAKDSESEPEQLQKQREMAKAEQLRQEQAQQQLELERLNREKAKRLAELEQLRQEQATAKQQQEQEQEAQWQAELAKAEQLRQEQAQRQFELERLNREKAKRLADLKQLKQAQAAAEQQQQEQQAREQAAEHLVRSYYEALNRQDADAAISRWWAPNESGLREDIKSIEWFRINKVKVRAGTVSEESAEVYVDVIGKKVDSNPERWSGPIRLEWAGGGWKIKDMDGLKQRTQ